MSARRSVDDVLEHVEVRHPAERRRAGDHVVVGRLIGEHVVQRKRQAQRGVPRAVTLYGTCPRRSTPRRHPEKGIPLGVAAVGV